MKLIDNTRKMVIFDSLSISEWFRMDGMIFMKIIELQGQNAICICGTHMGYTVWVPDNECVEFLNITVQIEP